MAAVDEDEKCPFYSTKIGLSDEELLRRGGECFDALYQQLLK